MPPSGAYSRNVSRLAPENALDRKRRKETMGAAERASTRRKQSSAPTPARPNPHTKVSCPDVAAEPAEPLMRAYVIAPRPKVASTAPGQSRLLLAASLRLSRTRHNESKTTAP